MQRCFLLRVAIPIVTFLCLAPAAGAYELRLVPSTPLENMRVGELVSFDAYLDTQGESDIVLFSTSLVFDDVGFDYRQDLSDAADQLLYSPAVPGGDPAYWLYSTFNAGCCDPPAQWTGSGPAQVQLNFVLNILSGPAPAPSTTATATNAWVGRLTFEATRPGSFDFDWGFGQAGNVFAGSDLVDIQDQISTPVTMTASVLIPEPSTALLAATGLGLMALAGRRRARR